MKLLLFAFSIYLSFLALMPCMDAVTCKNHDSEISSNVDHNHEHSEDENDLCTPFCTCACCGCTGFTVNNHRFSLSNPIDNIKISIAPSYQKNFISNYFYSFWQPPKISLS